MCFDWIAERTGSRSAQRRARQIVSVMRRAPASYSPHCVHYAGEHISVHSTQNDLDFDTFQKDNGDDVRKPDVTQEDCSSFNV